MSGAAGAMNASNISVLSVLTYRLCQSTSKLTAVNCLICDDPIAVQRAMNYIPAGEVGEAANIGYAYVGCMY